MRIETIEKKVNINRMIIQKKKIISLDEDVIIPDIKPDILKSLNASGNICILKKECQDGKIKLDGYANVNIIYMADSEENSVRGINSNIDFKEIIECKEVKEGMDINEKILIKSIECKVLNGRKINIKIELEIDLKVFSNEMLSVVNEINNIKDLQTITKNIKINSMVGSNKTKAYAKETIKIDINDKFAEILRSDLKIINKDIKVSYNKILAKSDLYIKLMYLTEDNRIRSVEEKIPVMGFIEMNNISEEDICETKYTIQNILIKPNSEEEHSIYVEIELEISCNAFKEENIEIIEDLYSPIQNIEYTSMELKSVVDKEVKYEEYKISEKIDLPQIIGEKVYDVRLTPNILKSKIVSGKVNYEGEILADFVISGNNGTTVDTISKIIPLYHSVEFENINENCKLETNIEVSMNDSVIENSEISINADFKFEIIQYKEEKINVIKEVYLNENEIFDNPYSMTIYFVKKGDTLWKIAKKYKSTIDEIAKLNEIKNQNRLDIGQQLFIPKHVCSLN